MNDRLQEIIAEVVTSTFEELAFMFGEQIDVDELGPLTGQAEAVQMKFSGHFPGIMTIALPDELTKTIAANMLGMDEDDDEAQEEAHDSLKEMLNVVCGHILTEVAGTEVVFDLSVPHVTRLKSEQWEILKKAPQTVLFELEDEPMLVNVNLKTDVDALLAE